MSREPDSEGRLVGLLLPIGIVFVALVVSNSMELGDRIAQHKRLQTNLTAVRQQVTVGQAKGRRLAEVGRGVLDLAPTNRYAADIQRRFRIRPTGSRGQPTAVEPIAEPATVGGATSAPPPNAFSPVAAPQPVAPGPSPTAPAVSTNALHLGIPLPATNAVRGSQFSLGLEGPSQPIAPQRATSR